MSAVTIVRCLCRYSNITLRLFCILYSHAQVTTHCPLMTQEELFIVTEAMGMEFALFDLHEFDSELDFSNKIGYFTTK